MHTHWIIFLENSFVHPYHLSWNSKLVRRLYIDTYCHHAVYSVTLCCLKRVWCRNEKVIVWFVSYISYEQNRLLYCFQELAMRRRLLVGLLTKGSPGRWEWEWAALQMRSFIWCPVRNVLGVLRRLWWVRNVLGMKVLGRQYDDGVDLYLVSGQELCGRESFEATVCFSCCCSVQVPIPRPTHTRWALFYSAKTILLPWPKNTCKHIQRFSKTTTTDNWLCNIGLQRRTSRTTSWTTLSSEGSFQPLFVEPLARRSALQESSMF